MAEVVFYSIANLVTLSLNEALIKDLWHCFNRKKEISTKCELLFLFSSSATKVLEETCE